MNVFSTSSRAFLAICFSLLAFSAWGQSLQETLTDSIDKYRTGLIIVQTRPGAEVELTQLKHEFWFGAALANQAFNGSISPEDEKKYKEVFLENFNAAVTENALKWQVMEREQGQVNFQTTDNILDWCDAHDIPLRGHNIYWGINQFVQDWVKALDDEALYQALRARGRMVAGRYKGRFVEYDLNNEMIHGNYYADRLGEGITNEMAGWVMEQDPNAVLYLNDYDILTGNRLDDFIQHAKDLLGQGVPIKGLGVQGHLHAEDFDRDALQNALDQLAELGLPILVTEFNMPGQRSVFYGSRDLKPNQADLEQQARNLVDYYRICFAHPAVKGILQWGFWEGAIWIPAAALYARDWTPRPAALAYKDLVYHQWWTTFQGKADEDGLCVIPAFYGEHRLRINGEEQVVTLKRENGVARVVFEK